MDWFVLLTPLLALAVVLLLGFTGCDRLFGLDPLPTGTLLLRTRVPTAITVTVCKFRYRPPGATSDLVSDGVPRAEGSDTFYEFSVAGPPPGTWSINCRLGAKNAAGQTVERNRMGTFALDPVATPAVVANWETVGMPGDPNYDLLWIGRDPP